MEENEDSLKSEQCLWEGARIKCCVWKVNQFCSPNGGLFLCEEQNWMFSWEYSQRLDQCKTKHRVTRGWTQDLKCDKPCDMWEVRLLAAVLELKVMLGALSGSWWLDEDACVSGGSFALRNWSNNWPSTNVSCRRRKEKTLVKAKRIATEQSGQRVDSLGNRQSEWVSAASEAASRARLSSSVDHNLCHFLVEMTVRKGWQPKTTLGIGAIRLPPLDTLCFRELTSG